MAVVLIEEVHKEGVMNTEGRKLESSVCGGMFVRPRAR